MKLKPEDRLRTLIILFISSLSIPSMALDYNQIKSQDSVVFTQNTLAYDLDSAWHIFAPANGRRWDTNNEDYPTTLHKVMLLKNTVGTVMKAPWIKVYIRGRTFADCTFTVEIKGHHYLITNRDSNADDSVEIAIASVRDFSSVQIVKAQNLTATASAE